MTTGGTHERERDGEDHLAAEYVLGVLDSAERASTERRIATDPAFARLVEGWEARLSPLAAEYREVEPPASVKAALDSRLFPSAPAAAPAGLWSSLALWRGLAAAAFVGLVLAVGLPLLRGPDQPSVRLAAVLSAEGSDVHYLALYDPSDGAIGLSHISGALRSGADFELWLIEGGHPPASLGVIPHGPTVRLAPGLDHTAALAVGAVFAISLEPEGGSPSGQPTGPVVASGEIRSL